MTNSDRPLTPNEPPALPNDEWELSELIQVITAELDQAQDTLILKSQNRRLSMMVNQLNLDLQVDVRRDPNGHLMFRTVAPGQTGATVLKLGFTPALDTQVQETRKSVDLETGDYRRLEDLPEIQSVEIQKLKTVGIHSVNDLEVATQTPAMLTEISSKSGLGETRLRLWRNLPLITQIKPESGAPGSTVILDGANFGAPTDTVEVYFQDKLARIRDRTNSRLTVEMPRNVIGGGLVVVKTANQKTNLLLWRADIVDLNVQDVVLDSPTPLVAGQEVTFRAILSNQGNVDAAGFDVSWEVSQVGIRRVPPLNSAGSMMLRAVVDDSDDIQATPTQSIKQVLYSHTALRSQQQSTDGALLFTHKFDQPGTYQISFTADPGNQIFDQLRTNNQFVREFVVNPPPPPAPLFNAAPDQFTPKFGKAGDIITLSGQNFTVGTAAVRFGSVNGTIVGTPTATQIMVRVPSFSRGVKVLVTVQTRGGTVTSTDSFTVVVPGYYGSGTAIGSNLL
ncbi:IPT/TIG domain-containing protein [Trichocoleus desertorum]|uniref:IPT/TIG domain-containing protein n=1 Tax=Trichocoleus desertorum GB2-A4 TaxID=2933944 RepID=A0ABV0JCC9_9CYAN|nr:IPT/TIG domain-containing protein [Trichocoleus sp. FACHB-46]